MRITNSHTGITELTSTRSNIPVFQTQEGTRSSDIPGQRRQGWHLATQKLYHSPLWIKEQLPKSGPTRKWH